MHNIVYYQSVQYDSPDGLNYESTHTQMFYILYFFKISKLQTLIGQRGLEGIVIKLLPDINQIFKKLYQFVPILLEKETWKDIESYLLFCL